MTWAAVAVGGAAVVGGYLSSQGAKNAANTQAGAASNAQQISKQEFNKILAEQAPFLQGGYGGLNQLDYMLGIGNKANYRGPSTTGSFGSLLQPFNMQDWKQLSPAYNFQRQQGMQGVLNADEANMGALSGAAQKDLIGFNNNLANTSFANAFNMYQQQQGNIYDRLAGIAQLGQNAASNVGSQGTQLAGQQAQSATNIGSALAAGQVGAANAWSGALTNASYIPYLMGGGMQQQAGQSAAGGP